MNDMERKIGEIFEYNGEWYQCVKSPDGSCKHSDMNFAGKCPIPIKECVASSRSDLSYVIFKKLEKVGEPFTIVGKLYQHYKVFDIDNVCGDVFWCVHKYKAKTLTIEIKQNQEDMEENKPKEDNPLTRVVYNYVNGKISDKELIRSIKEMSDEYPYNKNNLKPFSLELAKQGRPVCTRDGRKARIICFDRRGDKFPIVALLDGCNEEHSEVAETFTNEGLYEIGKKSSNDLMMLPEKKERWINIYKGTTRPVPGASLYDTEEEAKDAVKGDENYVTTTKVCWEE